VRNRLTIATASGELETGGRSVVCVLIDRHKHLRAAPAPEETDAKPQTICDMVCVPQVIGSFIQLILVRPRDPWWSCHRCHDCVRHSGLEVYPFWSLSQLHSWPVVGLGIHYQCGCAVAQIKRLFFDKPARSRSRHQIIVQFLRREPRAAIFGVSPHAESRVWWLRWFPLF